MVGTKSRIDEIRAHLDATQPGWQERTRAELDALTPHWESFPLLVWDEEAEQWVEVVLLANPEKISRPAVGVFARVRRWLGKK